MYGKGQRKGIAGILLELILLTSQYPKFVDPNTPTSKGLGINSPDKYCRIGQHVEGRWKFRDDIVKKSFVCCGYEAKDFRDESLVDYCHTESHNKYYYFGSDNTTHLDLMHATGNACVCDEFENTRFSVSRREKWVWEPNQCVMREWNATLFCSILGNRKIMMIGDSTLQQAASTLMSMLQSASPRGMCSSNIHMIQDYRLTSVQYIDKYYADIIIITGGAHFKNYTIYKEKMSGVLETMLGKKSVTKFSHLKTYNTSKVLLWKSISPGHLNCDLHKNATIIPNNYPVSEDKFLWGMAAEMDRIMRDLTGEKNIPILDMSPLFLRPDAHPGKLAWRHAKEGGDGLHYCLPGPLNIFATLLLHYLMDNEVVQ